MNSGPFGATPQGSHQNSECVHSVLIHWAITCDSFNVLAKNPKRSWVTIKKSDPKSYFLIFNNPPRHAPEANCLHQGILLFIIFNLICSMTMFVQNGFWTLRSTHPWPFPQGSHEISECVPPILIHRAITCDSFKVLAIKA